MTFLFINSRLCTSVAPQSQPTHMLNWYHLYKTRYFLDKRWRSPSLSSSSSSLGTGISHARFFEPVLTRLSGHGDSVYCSLLLSSPRRSSMLTFICCSGSGLEFDSRFIITGSRDRSIKVWELHGGRCVGTFVGGDRGHKGSVLCLKFEHEWHRLADGARGFMVSGSSDCTVCVWDIWVEGSEVRSEVRKVLKGHSGGVLDLRTCEHWIVSWYVLCRLSKIERMF
jgi:F-box and WD-40 domain protein 1/11